MDSSSFRLEDLQLTFQPQKAPWQLLLPWDRKKRAAAAPQTGAEFFPKKNSCQKNPVFSLCELSLKVKPQSKALQVVLPWTKKKEKKPKAPKKPKSKGKRKRKNTGGDDEAEEAESEHAEQDPEPEPHRTTKKPRISLLQPPENKQPPPKNRPPPKKTTHAYLFYLLYSYPYAHRERSSHRYAQNELLNYCGITNNFPQRIRKHRGELKSNANRYTAVRDNWQPVLHVCNFEDKSQVLRFEQAVKNLVKPEKSFFNATMYENNRERRNLFRAFCRRLKAQLSEIHGDGSASDSMQLHLHFTTSILKVLFVVTQEEEWRPFRKQLRWFEEDFQAVYETVLDWS
jgi:predicted GIY-YIG superfamily endonuclease